MNDRAVIRTLSLALALATALVVLSSTPLDRSPEPGAETDRALRDGTDEGMRPGRADGPVTARRCGSPELRGPATRPAGAREVTPSEGLSDVVDASPPGTTFWLRSGTYTFEGSPWGQVIPKNGHTFVGAPGAVLDGEGVNFYAFTGQAHDVTIAYLTIQNFGTATDNPSEGVVNHDSGRGWRVRFNTIRHNGGAGVFLGDDGLIEGNCLTENGQYGFQALDSKGGHIVDNEISGNNTADWEQRQPGCGCTGGGKFWNSRSVTVRGNWVHGNHGVGLFADTNNVGLLFEGNHVADNDAEGLLYEISYNARIVHNTFARNGWVKGPTNPGFPTGAVYISESGSDPRVPSRFSDRFVIAHNRFVDNWSGIVAWENADRFAGSPNNTSTGFSTLVDPERVDLDTCVPGVIDSEPHLSDCRWRTQRLTVTDNVFIIDRSAVPGCRGDRGCGYQGLFSNWGSSPEWSPYQGAVVEQDIVWNQQNRWHRNTYRGRWEFMVLDQATVVGMSAWRTRFEQDRGSVATGVSGRHQP